MNANDRQLIANVLGGIATSDYNSQVNSGTKLIETHPGIARMMTKNELAWWNLEHMAKDDDEGQSED